MVTTNMLQDVSNRLILLSYGSQGDFDRVKAIHCSGKVKPARQQNNKIAENLFFSFCTINQIVVVECKALKRLSDDIDKCSCTGSLTRFLSMCRVRTWLLMERCTQKRGYFIFILDMKGQIICCCTIYVMLNNDIGLSAEGDIWTLQILGSTTEPCGHSSWLHNLSTINNETLWVSFYWKAADYFKLGVIDCAASVRREKETREPKVDDRAELKTFLGVVEDLHWIELLSTGHLTSTKNVGLNDQLFLGGSLRLIASGDHDLEVFSESRIVYEKLVLDSGAFRHKKGQMSWNALAYYKRKTEVKNRTREVVLRIWWTLERWYYTVTTNQNNMDTGDAALCSDCNAMNFRDWKRGTVQWQ